MKEKKNVVVLLFFSPVFCSAALVVDVVKMHSIKH